MTPIRTIYFKKMTENDLDFFNSVRNSCAKEYLHDSRYFTIDETKEWFKTTQNLYYIIFLIENNIETNIGYFRLSNLSTINKNIYIGADLDENWRGQGLAYDAYKTFIPILFEMFDLHKISLEVLATNTRAINLYKKLYFVEEGRKRDDVLKNGIYVDSIIMSLLKKEWNKKFAL